MSKKLLIYMISFCSVLGLVSNAVANTYTDAGPTHFWNDPCNWSLGVVPKYSPCLLYTSPSPRDLSTSRMPSSA